VLHGFDFQKAAGPNGPVFQKEEWSGLAELNSERDPSLIKESFRGAHSGE